MYRKKQGSSKGFSMVELLTVMASTAVIFAMAVPSYTSTRDVYRLTTARTELAGVIEKTRAEAIKREVNTTVTINNTGQYQMQYNVTPSPLTWVYSLPQGVNVNLPSNMAKVVVTCTPAGRVTIEGRKADNTSAGPVTNIALSNKAGGKVLSISVAGNISFSNVN